jgi:hypothetical protein
VRVRTFAASPRTGVGAVYLALVCARDRGAIVAAH